MRLVILDTADDVADLVAKYVVKRITEFKPTAARPFVLGLPTGSTPQRAYGEMVKHYKEGKVSFEHVITFNMDE
jgi:glucosamine-6-phosphate deaminase